MDEKIKLHIDATELRDRLVASDRVSGGRAVLRHVLGGPERLAPRAPLVRERLLELRHLFGGAGGRGVTGHGGGHAEVTGHPTQSLGWSQGREAMR